MSSTVELNINNSDSDTTLLAIENGSYLNINNSSPSYFAINDVKRKIQEFSEYLNSVGRISLLKCDKIDKEETRYLLSVLDLNIKNTFNQLGRSYGDKTYNFGCSTCETTIDLSTQRFWDCLQSHEHFEEILNKCGSEEELIKSVEKLSVENTEELSAADKLLRVLEKPAAAANSYEEINQSSKAETDYVCSNVGSFKPSSMEDSSEHEKGANNFRFNFVLPYDEVIGSKIYPSTITKFVQRFAGIKEYTVQKSGPYKAICLLCPCELIGLNKLNRQQLLDHCAGQRHQSKANNPENVESLRKYHESWQQLDVNFQSHQVFIRPETPKTLKCTLCSLTMGIGCTEMKQHILSAAHKKKVMNIFNFKSNSYYLVNNAVQVYGLTDELIAAKRKELTQKQQAKALLKKTMIVEKKTDKNESDSSTSPSSDPKTPIHNIIKSVDNPTSKNVLDLLPNRFKGNLQFLKQVNYTIACLLCKVTLSRDVTALIQHIQLPKHVTASKIEVKKYNYHCEICNIRVSNETIWQQHFSEGQNKHANMAASRKALVSEYECINCCGVIFGDELSLSRHLSTAGARKDVKIREITLPENVKRLFKNEDFLENHADHLTKEANDTLMCDQRTMKCCHELEKVLNLAFPGCKVYPFGSRITGLGNKDSDLDVFVDTGDMYTGHKNQDGYSQVQLVRKATAILTKNRKDFEDVVPIPTARTPIVQVLHKNTGIDCDLSFRHALSIENTKFIRFCLDLQPTLQPMILLLKQWLAYTRLNEHITTYAIAILAIFYLQITDYLPSITKLKQLNSQKSYVINGWETINYTVPLEKMKNYVKPYTESVTTLLKDFFKYYSEEFLYETDVVCPLLGHSIKKSLFVNEVNLPPEMAPYVRQLDNEEPERFRAFESFCIQDPFDLSHNLTKACQAGIKKKFKTLCELSYKHLDSFNC